MDFEIVAVDDGSRDDTLLSINDWTFRDQRMHALALSHQGIICCAECRFEGSIHIYAISHNG